MRARIAVWTGLAAVMAATAATAQPPAEKKPVWAAGHDLKVRKAKDTDWDKAARVGVEVFKDPTAAAVVVISQGGFLDVAPDDAVPNKKADWATGFNFAARRADEDKFTPATAVFGVETYKNALTGQLLYLSEKEGVALAPAAGAAADRDPQFQYGLILKVRKPGEADFGKDTKRFGLEAYKDQNTGGTVYVTEAGLIATGLTSPDKPPEAKDVKKPKPLYGLELRARKAGEGDFTDKTQKFGVEVFRDENTGTLLYISETGSIAAAPPPADLKADPKLVPVWSHALNLKARGGGVAEFAKATQYGVEVFADKHTGYLVYITEKGSIAVLPRK